MNQAGLGSRYAWVTNGEENKVAFKHFVIETVGIMIVEKNDIVSLIFD